ncbi:MAG: 5-methylthioadenosine/S-adenosylhomocysteine deaminase [Flavobacterium sp.]|jgi:5-methylthioadenosine/S-adenosylhomocysteine deaminase
MQMKDPYGFIIHPTWIAPVRPVNRVLRDHCLVIKDNLIIDLLPAEKSRSKYPEWPVQVLDQHILIPGLINTHGHAAMSLLRGYADDLELMDWLNNHIWPVENRLMSYEYVYDGTVLAIAEMMSTGTTCAADSYFFPDAMAKAYQDHHFRAQICLPVIQFPNAWASSESEHIEKAIAIHHALAENDLMTTAFAPHAPYTVTDQGFKDILSNAQALKMPIHLHLHETQDEVQSALDETGMRPIERLHNLGLINNLLQAVHMTQLTQLEISLLAENGVQIAHCPDSNLKLASGFCPVSELRDANVNVSVGTDSVASNNNLDMLAEIRSAALLAKGISGKATTITAGEALEMGTINGARFLGLEDKIGSLEIGKQADLISIDLSAPNFQPVHNPLSQLIYSASGHQVDNVWISGRQTMRNNELLDIDLPKLMTKVKHWRDKINTPLESA